MDIIAMLSAPLDPAKVSWRVGSTTADKKRGMALAYIDARDVMARLDAACGAGGWQDRYEFHGPRTICYLSIKIGEEWITKADGAGDSDVEAEKGAISDAFKRAAVKWGIGRYLYDIESPWVEIVGAGRSFKIADHERARLARLLPGSRVDAGPASEPADTPFDADEPTGESPVVTALIRNAWEQATREKLDAWYQSQKAAIRELPDNDRAKVATALQQAGARFKKAA